MPTTVSELSSPTVQPHVQVSAEPACNEELGPVPSSDPTRTLCEDSHGAVVLELYFQDCSSGFTCLRNPCMRELDELDIALILFG